MHRLRSIAPALLLTILSIGCGSSGSVTDPDSGAESDAQLASDALSTPDAQQGTDAHVAVDADVFADADVLMDGDVAIDADVVHEDAGVSIDGDVVHDDASVSIDGDIAIDGDVLHEDADVVHEDASVEADAAEPPTVVVMPLGDHVSMSPSGDTRIAPGATATFTITPELGRAFSPLVRGTCPKGGWDGFVYTTGAIDEDCTVDFRSVVPVLTPATWSTDSRQVDTTTSLDVLAGSTDSVEFDYEVNSGGGFGAENWKFMTARSVATEDQAALFEWTWFGERLPEGNDGGLQLMFFAEGPEGRTTVRVYDEDPGAGAFMETGTVALPLRAGYAFGVHAFDSKYGNSVGSVVLTTLATSPSFEVYVSAHEDIELSDWAATVTEGATPSFVATAPEEVALPTTPGGTCPVGSWDGTRYTTGPVTESCTIDFDVDGTGSPIDPEEGPPSEALRRPNRAPMITLGHDLFFNTDPHLYTALAWADPLPGPGREAFQKLTATLDVTETTGTLAFDTHPVLDPVTGTLYFAATAGTFGSATVLVTLVDDGGTDDGGVDTTTASFTITVNTPVVALDESIRNPWRSPCVPVTMRGNDPDRVTYTTGEKVYLEYLSAPSRGFLTPYLSGSRSSVASARRDGGPRSARPFVEHPHDVVGTSGEEIVGFTAINEFATSLCYIPFTSTFKGTDSFVFRLVDIHGGVSADARVNFDIYED